MLEDGNSKPDPINLNLQLRQICETLPRNNLKRGEINLEDFHGGANIVADIERQADSDAEVVDVTDSLAMVLSVLMAQNRRVDSELREKLIDTWDNKLSSFSQATIPCNWYVRHTIVKYSKRGIDPNGIDPCWFIAEEGKGGIFSQDPLEVFEIEKRGSNRIQQEMKSGEGLYVMSEIDGESTNITALELSAQFDQWKPAYQEKYDKPLI